MKYLEQKGYCLIKQKKNLDVLREEKWMSQSLLFISLAAREKLDNLIFVINCNLQRLDGPVRGNSRIITELGAIFKAAGWNVVNTVWVENGTNFYKDSTGALQWVMNIL